MKIFKLKYFVILMALGFLWSCQTEDVVNNGHKAIGVRKKNFERDGIPSDSDDQYEFSKSQYYHNDKLLTDTIQIKNLLSNARLLHIDGSRKYICSSDQEANLLNQKLNIKTSTTEKTTALDGDNYLHYFYEIARYDRSRSTVYCEFLYFSIVGPHIHSSTTPENYKFQYYRRTGLTGNPTYVKTVDTSVMTGITASTFRNIYNLFTNCEVTGSATVPGTNLEHWEVNFTINVINTTRYTRNVEIVADNGSVVRFALAPKKGRAVGGFHNFGVPRKFNGIEGFIVKWIRSNKA